MCPLYLIYIVGCICFIWSNIFAVLSHASSTAQGTAASVATPVLVQTRIRQELLDRFDINYVKKFIVTVFHDPRLELCSLSRAAVRLTWF